MANDEVFYAQFWHTLILDIGFNSSIKKSACPKGPIAILKRLQEGLSGKLQSIINEIDAKYRASFESSEVILIEKERRLKFPVLNVTINEECSVTISINPCLGEGAASPTTKIITAPQYKGRFSPKGVTHFFTVAKDLSKKISALVISNYLEELRKYYNLSDTKEDPYHLYVYAVGSKDRDFVCYVQYSNNEKEMKKAAIRSPLLRKSIKLLQQVRIPAADEAYDWFTQESEGRKALCGFYGTEGEGNFICLADDDPQKITGKLVRDVVHVT